MVPLHPQNHKYYNLRAGGESGGAFRPRLAKSGAFKRPRGAKMRAHSHRVETAGNGEDGGEPQLGSAGTLERHNYFKNGTPVTEVAQGLLVSNPHI